MYHGRQAWRSAVSSAGRRAIGPGGRAPGDGARGGTLCRMTDPTPPAGPALEPVWHIEATYAPDAAETRVPHRARHLARIQALKASGVVVEAGAFLDVSASVLLIRAGSQAEALDVCRQDVYMQNGVWVELRARPFGRVRDAEGGPTGG